MPASLRGALTAPPNESNGYEGGALPGIRVLGAYLGDDACAGAQASSSRESKSISPIL